MIVPTRPVTFQAALPPKGLKRRPSQEYEVDATCWLPMPTMAWRSLVPILRSSWCWTWRQSYSAIASLPYPPHWERSLRYGNQAGRTYKRSCCGRCNHFLRFVVLRRRLSQKADPITPQAVSGHAQVDAPNSPASQGPARGLDSSASGR